MPRTITTAEVFDLAQQAPSRSAFRREVALGLQQQIGSELAVFHDVAPRVIDPSTMIGADENILGRARDAHAGPYSAALMPALRGGQSVVDAELFGTAGLRNTAFFNEVHRPAGLAQLMYSLVAFRGTAPAFVALGRSRGSGFTPEDCTTLARLNQTLALADAALDRPEESSPLATGMTKGQQDLLSYIRIGLTNRQIALALSISPNTVRNRIAHLFRLCEVSSRAELVYAMTRRPVTGADAALRRSR